MDVLQKNKVLTKAYEWSLIFFVLTMPFNAPWFNLNGVAIGVLAAVSLLLAMNNRREIQKRPEPVLLLSIGFFLMYVASVLYSSNAHEANFNIEKKMSLFIFPVIMYITPRISVSAFNRVLQTFVLSVIASCTVALLISLSEYVRLKNTEVFYYHELSSNTGMHAGYLAMYLCFAISFLLFQQGNGLGLFKRKILWIGALVLLSIYVLMLSSRLQIGIMCMIYIVYALKIGKLGASVPKAIGYSFVLGVFLLCLVLLFPKNRERFKEAINYNNEYALSKKWGEGQMRKLIWTSAFEIIAQNPLIGVGVGDVQDELDRVYKKNDFISLTYFSNTRFNAHNQLLETALAIGSCGIIVFLTLLVRMVRQGIKQNNTMLLAFICIFVLSSITESILERQNGIVFYSFFSMFLYFKKPD